MNVKEALCYIRDNISQSPRDFPEVIINKTLYDEIVKYMETPSDPGPYKFAEWVRMYNSRMLFNVVDEPKDILVCTNKKDAFGVYIDTYGPMWRRRDEIPLMDIGWKLDPSQWKDEMQ